RAGSIPANTDRAGVNSATQNPTRTDFFNIVVLLSNFNYYADTGCTMRYGESTCRFPRPEGNAKEKNWASVWCVAAHLLL
ncbi:MAG TPA: hypothetical protein PK373_11655, partial [Sedimentisphaerales bacterium]|nr:hypothetical protein [Sedimentisphaerales bacterium]